MKKDFSDSQIERQGQRIARAKIEQLVLAAFLVVLIPVVIGLLAPPSKTSDAEISKSGQAYDGRDLTSISKLRNGFHAKIPKSDSIQDLDDEREASLHDSNPGKAQCAGDEKPNIILINLDDADSSLLTDRMLQQYYPNMNRIATSGIRFTNLHVTTPFCGPSRASLMTGQYAFHSGVRLNDSSATATSNGFKGGYREFIQRGHHENELGVWMKRAGYRTMHVGKYHHNCFDYKVPPGWDDFYVTLGARYVGSYRFSNEIRKSGKKFQTKPEEYVTDISSKDATRVVRTHNESNTEQPFFLYIAPIAPHRPHGEISTMIPARYAEFASDETIANDPDWNECDIADKPKHLQFSKLGANDIADLEFEHLCRIQALKSVDDLVGNLVEVLTETNQLTNSYIFLTSDNGFQLGHHRMRNKMDPFDRTSKVPLFAMGPEIEGDQTANHLIAHIDICPTILELAGANVPESVEGKSFVKLLDNPDSANPQDWQEAIMIENWSQKTTFRHLVPAAYTALRMYDSVYVRWATGSSEYYDLATDPFQLNNRYKELSLEVKNELRSKMRRFRSTPSQPEITINEHLVPEVFSSNIWLDGMVEDNSGVEEIGLVIKSLTSGKYFDGEAWCVGWRQLFVAPVAAESLISYWHYHNQIELPDDLRFDFLAIGLRPYEIDDQFPVDHKWQIIPIDNSPPRAFLRPRSNRLIQHGQSIILQGTYAENHEIKSVRVTFYHPRRKKFWDGMKYVEDWTFVNADVDSRGNWNVATKPGLGPHSVSVRAVDAAGNLQREPETCEIFVKR